MSRAANDNAEDLPGVRSHSNGAVLLGEDDAEMRRRLATALRKEGLSVIECASGTDLLMTARREWLAHERPMCVITDVHMSGCSDLEATRDMRLLGWQMPILMLKSSADSELLHSAAELGARVLDKPLLVSAVCAVTRASSPPCGQERPLPNIAQTIPCNGG